MPNLRPEFVSYMLRRHRRRAGQLPEYLAGPERRQTIRDLRIFLREANIEDVHKSYVYRAMVHEMAEESLAKKDLRLFRKLLALRPEMSASHLLAALQVWHKKSVRGGKRRVRACKNELKKDPYVSPLTVAYAVRHLGDQTAKLVAQILSHENYLNHPQACAELVHQLVWRAGLEKETKKVSKENIEYANTLLMHIRNHAAVKNELRTIQKKRQVHFLFQPALGLLKQGHTLTGKTYGLTPNHQRIVSQALSNTQKSAAK
ncbi:hypothetical protein HY994_01265 [Candidatus Micrarchaeota archaeon]|nr:hypothetical protein [Candidatus Micrarchaeota archaeon]